MYEYHKSFDTLIAVDLNKQLLEAMTGRLCDGSLPSRIGGRGVVQAGGGVIMVISFSFHPLCLPLFKEEASPFPLSECHR